MGMVTLKSTVMSVKACQPNRTMASGRNVVLRNVKSASAKERIDPGMVELRAILLLKRDLRGACGQRV